MDLYLFTKNKMCREHPEAGSTKLKIDDENIGVTMG